MTKLFRIEYDASGKPVKEFLEVFENSFRDNTEFREHVKENYGNGTYQIHRNIKNKTSGKGQLKYDPPFIIKNARERQETKEVRGKILESFPNIKKLQGEENEMSPQEIEFIIGIKVKLESIEKKMDDLLKIANEPEAAAPIAQNQNALLGSVVSGDLGAVLGMLGIDPQIAGAIQLMHSKAQANGTAGNKGIDLSKFAGEKKEEVNSNA
jgi:hypothetical protein